MKEVKKAATTQAEQKKILEKLEKTYSRLSGGQQQAENDVVKIETEIQDIDTFISTETDKTDVYVNAQTIVGYLNAIDDGCVAIKKSRTAIDTENKKLTDELTSVSEKAREDAKNAKCAFEREESEVKAKEETVAALNLPELREKRDRAKDLLGRLLLQKTV